MATNANEEKGDPKDMVKGEGDGTSESLKAHCPTGMESLIPLTFLRVQQEVALPWDREGLWNIFDLSGNLIFQALERTSCCCARWCGANRCFTAKVMNPAGQVVLIIRRPCTRLCRSKVKVSTGDGALIGSVKQDCCRCLSMSVYDNEKTKIMRIKGPCACKACCEVKFKVTNMEKEEIGVLQKKWGGFFMEAFTFADTFGVTFPAELDAYQKALLLAAVFLADVLYFEKSN